VSQDCGRVLGNFTQNTHYSHVYSLFIKKYEYFGKCSTFSLDHVFKSYYVHLHLIAHNACMLGKAYAL